MDDVYRRCAARSTADHILVRVLATVHKIYVAVGDKGVSMVNNDVPVREGEGYSSSSKEWVDYFEIQLPDPILETRLSGKCYQH